MQSAVKWSYVSILFVLCLAGSAQGGLQKDGLLSLPGFSRYRDDQVVPRIAPGQVQVLGRRLGDKLHMSESQAIEMALINNIGINAQRLEPVFRLWEIHRQSGAYDSNTNFGFNWDRTVSPSASILSGGESITDVITGYTFGFDKPFPTGTTLSAKFDGNRNRSTNFFSSLVPAIHTNFRVDLRQNLLEGLGRVDSEYGIEVARKSLSISELEFAKLVFDVVVSVQQTYWDLLFTIRDIEVKNQSVLLAREVLQQNSARFEVGAAPRLEVVEAEAEVASRREELVRATYSRQQVQDRLVQLITSLPDPRELNLQIVPDDPVYTPGPVTDSFEQLVDRANRQRPELLVAEAQIESDSIEIARSRNRLKPRLDLVLAYQQLGLGGRNILRDFSQGFIDPPIIEIQPGGLGDSLEQLFSGDFYGYTVGFDFRVPLGNREARAENARALIAHHRAQLMRTSLAQSVAREIRDALTEIEMNHARLEAAAAALLFARERLQGEQARFEVGRGTTRTYIEAQRDLSQAAVVELQAQINLIKSHVSLHQAVGSTLDRQGIRIKDELTRNLR